MSRSAAVLAALTLGCAVPDDRGSEPRNPAPEAGPQPFAPYAVGVGPGVPAASHATVPMSGGTLLPIPGSSLVLASDPEGDRIVAIDLYYQAVAWTVDLGFDATPFRLAASPRAAFATLRGARAIARIDLDSQDVTLIDPGCGEPRGIAWDDARQTLWLACAGGEIRGFDDSGLETAAFAVDSDARDIVPLASTLAVSHLRTAAVSFVDSTTGQTLSRVAPVDRALEVVRQNGQVKLHFVPRVAWRMRAGPDGESVVIAHQYALTDPIDLASDDGPDGGSAYGSPDTPCDHIVNSAFTALGVDGPIQGAFLEMGSLPIDLDRDPRSGTWRVLSGGTGVIAQVPTTFAATCAVPGTEDTPGTAVAIAYDELGRRIVQQQAPFGLWVDGMRIDLGPDEPPVPELASANAFGLFHDATPSGLSCAGCHPEGQDDGHVWDFGRDGLRRTQNLAVGLADTAPYHWDAQFPTVEDLLRDVMVDRMGGIAPGEPAADSLVSWLDGVPAVHPPPSGNAAEIARGEALFQSAELGCTGCHGGDEFTSNTTSNVGTGGAFQAPSLIGVGARGPWMHDGCATTLAMRFTDPTCGGTTHGGAVVGADVDALVAYLNTL
jgi:hypothetical protein